jgi:hypothetical protein
MGAVPQKKGAEKRRKHTQSVIEFYLCNRSLKKGYPAFGSGIVGNAAQRFFFFV